jgi:hypothetical protein
MQIWKHGETSSEGVRGTEPRRMGAESQEYGET